MKPTINSNHMVRSRATTRECGCHGITSLFQANFQDPNGPLLNTVPPEVIRQQTKMSSRPATKAEY